MRAVLTIARVKPERLSAYVEACQVYGTATLAEPSCARFDLIADDGDAARICIFESYRDPAAYDEHLASPHFQRWRDEVMDWYAEPPTVIRGVEIRADEEPASGTA